MNYFAIDHFLYQGYRYFIPVNQTIDFQFQGKNYQLFFEKIDYSDSKIPYLLQVAIYDEYKHEISKPLLGYIWRRFYFATKQIHFLSPDKRYIFLPLREAAIIDLADHSIIQLFSSNSKLIGNIFYENFHLTIYQQAIVVTHLHYRTTSTVLLLNKKQHIQWAELCEDGSILYRTQEQPTIYQTLNSRRFHLFPPDQVERKYIAQLSKQSKIEELTKYDYLKAPSIKHRINGRSFEIEILGWEEPNNGRMVTDAKFLIDGKDQKTHFISYYFKENIAKTQFFSPNLKYIFLPGENDSAIISTDDLSHFKITVYGRSMAEGAYIGNVFIDDLDVLLIFSTKMITIVNLKDKIAEKIHFSAQGRVIFTTENYLFFLEKIDHGPTIYHLLESTVLN